MKQQVVTTIIRIKFLSWFRFWFSRAFLLSLGTWFGWQGFGRFFNFHTKTMFDNSRVPRGKTNIVEIRNTARPKDGWPSSKPHVKVVSLYFRIGISEKGIATEAAVITRVTRSAVLALSRSRCQKGMRRATTRSTARATVCRLTPAEKQSENHGNALHTLSWKSFVLSLSSTFYYILIFSRYFLLYILLFKNSV